MSPIAFQTLPIQAVKASLIVTSRFLAYFPQNHSIPFDLTGRFSVILRELGLRVGRSSPYFFACGSEKETGEAVWSERLVLDVFEGTAASGRRFSFDGGSTPEWSAWHKEAARSAQFYNLIHLSSDAFRLESDPLGLKPVYEAQVRGGVLLASRIGDLLKIAPELTRPIDRAAVYELFVFNGLLGNRTLHEPIRRSLPGACYRWKKGEGLRVRRERHLQAPRVDATISLEAAADRAWEMLRENLKDRIEGLEQAPLCIALSGGFDSRLLAAMAREMKIPSIAFTYGSTYHREVQIAREVSRALGMRQILLPYPSDTLLTRINSHLEHVEAQTDLGGVQIANLLQIEAAAGMPLMHGFIGGALAGHRLRSMRDHEFSDPAALTQGILRSFLKEVNPSDQVLAEGAWPRESVWEDLRSSLSDAPHLYQTFILWVLERQRGFIGSHLQILGSRFDQITPFYCVSVIDAWLSLPRSLFDGKSLLRHILSSRYPALAKIPHSKEEAPITPNLRYQFLDYIRGKETLLRRHLPGAERRHPDIERLWCDLTPSQRTSLCRRIDSLRSTLESVLGLKLADDAEILRQSPAAVLRNLWLLAEYALKLSGSHSTSANPSAKTDSRGEPLAFSEAAARRTENDCRRLVHRMGFCS